MTIFMLFNFAFDHFFDWRAPKSTNCKKPHFFQKSRKMWFYAICGFWGCPIKKMIKSKVEEHKNRH